MVTLGYTSRFWTASVQGTANMKPISMALFSVSPRCAPTGVGAPWAWSRLVAAWSIIGLALCGCGTSSEAPKVGIVAGTSLIADVMGALSEEKVSAYPLLPSTSCPSQFDMKPGDLARLREASLVVLHPWQLQLANISRALDVAGVPEDKRRIVDVPGNWMLPETQAAAAHALSVLLSEMHAVPEDVLAERVENRIRMVETIAQDLRDQLAGRPGDSISVLCQEMQQPFIEWAGFVVVESYKRPEDWSVADTERLVRLGRERGVKLVIDNLQSGGARMSEALARDSGAVHVVLSNFPGGFPDTPTWASAFTENVGRLEDALKQVAAS